MFWLISTLLEIMAAALVLVPMYLLLNKLHFHSIRKSIIYCLFSFYLVAVYALVGMPNVTYIRLDLTLNLIPIAAMIGDLRSTILNVLLFIPLGIVLPVLWQKFRARKNTILFGLGMSLAIELLQIFTYRATDINDLITNTFGCFLGFLFANLLMKKFPAFSGLVSEHKTNELYIVFGVVLVVMFFIQPFLFSILWDIFIK